MNAIWKYPIPVADEFQLEMPMGARPLTVQVQDGKPYLWALVNTEFDVEPHRFRLAGTGHPLEEDVWSYAYVGTFQVRDGRLVFHVFYKGLGAREEV